MRAKEFISEDHQKLDEAIFLPLLWVGGIAWQGIETANDIKDYNSGKIDGWELSKRIGKDAAAAVVGGVAGKGLSLGWNALKSAMKFKGAGKEALDTTKDAIKQANKAPKPGSVVKTADGKKAIAGVDGKPTTVKPGDKPAIAQIKKAAKDPKNKAAGKTGAVAGAVAKKGNKAAKTGAPAASIGSKAKKLIPGKAARRGALAGVYANQTKDFIDDMGGIGGIGDKFDRIVDKIDKGTGTAGDVGDGVVYFGKEKNPPMKKVAGVNDPLYTKPNNAVKDSNSPVPTAKDPKLPKQNTTSLSTQPGVK